MTQKAARHNTSFVAVRSEKLGMNNDRIVRRNKKNLCARILNTEDDRDGKVGNTYKGQRTKEMLDTGAAPRY